MIREQSQSILRRIFIIALIQQILLFCLIYLFTKQLIYSIITILAAAISISGFLIMIRIVDKIISDQKGRGSFFAASVGKMIIISAGFYPVSRISETAVLFYILGLSAIILAILFEAGHQILRKS